MTPDERALARMMIDEALHANSEKYALFLSFILDLDIRVATLERDATR